MSTIREQLIPLIRAAGVRKTAMRVGLHHGTLIGWMKGTRNINVHALERLVQYLGLAMRIEPCRELPNQPTSHTHRLRSVISPSLSVRLPVILPMPGSTPSGASKESPQASDDSGSKSPSSSTPPA